MSALKLTTLLCLITAFEFGFNDALPSGYTHISSLRAYYKYHTKGATWSDAVSTCRSEGARLFHPDSANELEQVWREMAVGNNGDGNYLHTGLSDIDESGEFKTVDGRPVSQVYNKWSSEPESYGSSRCARLAPSTHLLYVMDCTDIRRFICKYEEEVTATANARVAALEQQLANQTAAVELLKEEASSLKLQVSNQTEVIKQEIEAIKKVQAENQPSVLLEKISVAIANQARALERIAEADANQAEALKQIAEADANQAAALDRLQRHAANQTAAVERQALAMEMFVGPQENNQQ